MKDGDLWHTHARWAGVRCVLGLIWALKWREMMGRICSCNISVPHRDWSPAHTVWLVSFIYMIHWNLLVLFSKSSIIYADMTALLHIPHTLSFRHAYSRRLNINHTFAYPSTAPVLPFLIFHPIWNNHHSNVFWEWLHYKHPCISEESKSDCLLPMRESVF